MKIEFSNGAKRPTIIFICALLITIIVLNVGGYFLNLKYVSVFAAMAEVDKYEVRSRLLMEAMKQVGVCEPEEAAKVWARGLINRSAALQYSVLNNKLKADYAAQLEQSFPNWVTGMSSPWVDSYEIVNTIPSNNNGMIVELKLSTKTSTGPAGDFDAALTIALEDEFWRITKLAIDKELFVYTGFMPK